ncbi:MAG: class II aldolase/adducin family protein, partial [bacterium]|nr:class II aldolase/adducin family protein [bacterium]
MASQSQKTEAQLRIELAAAYRLIDHWGLNEVVYNHISVRLPGDPPQFLINPFGLLYHEITASNLAKIDLEGQLTDPAQEKAGVKVNPAGFIIHSAIHEKRDDAQCIVHTHTEAGIAVASLRPGFVPYGQESMRFYNRVAYHEFNGIVLDPK